MIEVAGRDATQVINNLSTNDLKKLPLDAHQETFITDARGWVVAHAAVLKNADRVWLIGSHENPSKIFNHIDRYIIREEAIVTDHSAAHCLLVIGNGDGVGKHDEQTANLVGSDTSTVSENVEFDASEIIRFSCRVPILGSASRLLGCRREHGAQAEQKYVESGVSLCSDEFFEWLRISSFWPLSPADIGEKTIPQELDRDQHAISFTKGCYLGQETIARLDARGQLQKKLCLVEIAGNDSQFAFQTGDQLTLGDKEVGHLTSLAQQPGASTWRALAMLRRGNFTPGTELQCRGHIARVLPVT